MTAAALVRRHLESLLRANAVYGEFFDLMTRPEVMRETPDAHFHARFLGQLVGAMEALAHVLDMAGVTAGECEAVADQMDREATVLAGLTAES
jgi:hypothetical protein